ncbi:flagellar hook-length control protein FliK [Pseudomonas sp. BP8]|uniref:flagellar hook-length control protein FliK n=1 Tax=Pseudomonas sp. BP8 TaxID=2817864 RepID=UPI001AE47B55|nr:flagellar hook-length control protein FliK [Pseudomonas sp. BP8]MBP2261176.1 flagellar hook-length control protein FliK [Pseudomonas sp. BP8]HDS1734482.1 flagellar hook-length control protein FliK [Pseudomonas putida]
MPVSPNPLLQANVAGASSRASAAMADKPQRTAGEQGKGFDQVMARQADDKVAQGRPKGTQGSAPSGNKDAGDKPAVAADGNKLPANDPSQQAADSAQSDSAGSLDANLVAGQVSDAQPGAQLIQAQAEAVAPVLQAVALQPAATAVEEAVEEAFDPEADALAGLPTLRLALEQSAQAKGTTSAHASAQPASDDQAAVNTLANLVGQAEAEGGESEPGDNAFGNLLEDGLKDTKSASSDTRVDNFADRLANLTQAATAKTANAVPATPAPLHQPLAMNQGAWTEGLVNRVMYLSSQNLKSADIQLEPAELGRLDIRVNVATDQSTQVTFISGHAGVRDTLDSQLHRLRELFAQQGLAQPDVSVADQSRGQQQQAQQDASQLSGVAARRAEAAAAEQGGTAEAARPMEQQVVIGDSAVDYYA